MSELTREILLRELETGAALSRVLARHGAKQALVNKWKKEDALFVQQLDRALAFRHRTAGRTLEQRHPDLHDRFIAACNKLGKEVSIAGAVRLLNKDGIEVSVGSMYSRLTPGKSLYDPALDERFTEAQAQRVAPVEDGYWRQVAEDSTVAEKLAAIERHPLTKHRYQRPTNKVEVDLKQEQTVRLVQEHRKVLHVQFQQEAAERFGPTTQEIIDVEPTERSDAADVGGDDPDERELSEAEEQAQGEAEGQAQEQVAASA